MSWPLAAAITWALLIGSILYRHHQRIRRRDDLEALIRATSEGPGRAGDAWPGPSEPGRAGDAWPGPSEHR